MEKINIIRIEGEDGFGIFGGKKDILDIGLKKLYDRHFDSTNRNEYIPTPNNDGCNMSKNEKEWYCAFKSLEQFNMLLKGNEIKILIKNKFNIYLLEVGNYQIGYHQVIYTKESITKSENINSLFL